MNPQELNNFRNIQNTCENDTELVAKLLFDILPKVSQGNEIKLRAIAEQSKEYGDSRQVGFRAEKQREALISVSEQIISEIREKDIDLSQVVNALSDIKKSIDEKEHDNGAESIIEAINAKHPELEHTLKEIANLTAQNKPSEIDLSEVVSTQKEGFKKLAEILSGILTEMACEKEKEEHKEIELKKPVWYKPFEWKPLEKLLNPIKEILISIRDKKAEQIPFNFDKDGNLRVAPNRVGSSGSKPTVALEDETGKIYKGATEETLAEIKELIGEDRTAALLEQLVRKIPNLMTRSNVGSLYVYTDTNSTITNYEYLSTAASSKLINFDGPIQSRQLWQMQRNLITID